MAVVQRNETAACSFKLKFDDGPARARLRILGSIGEDGSKTYVDAKAVMGPVDLPCNLKVHPDAKIPSFKADGGSASFHTSEELTSTWSNLTAFGPKITTYASWTSFSEQKTVLALEFIKCGPRYIWFGWTVP